MSGPTGTTIASTLPRVAIVGRPNVGKSTLMNRIVGRREAIVEEKPGVTRDRREHTVDWNGVAFRVVDTGGWEVDPHDSIGMAVRKQAERAISESDVIVLVCDGAVGPTGEDVEAARVVLRAGIPAVLAVNKVDGAGAEVGLAEFWQLGLGEPMPISALHGRRSGDLLDAIVASLPEEPDVSEPDPGALAEASVAIVGRPNVGKSTLFNRLCGDERSIVHDAPGTTRDSIDTVVEFEGTRWRFVDTAGLRRRAKVDDRTEYYSRVRALHALGRAEIALLLVDATEGVTFADQKVAEEVAAAGCAVVILLNKWDLLGQDDKLAVVSQVADRLHFLGWAPVLRVSARTGHNLHRLNELLLAVLDSYRTRVPTAAITRVVEEAQDRHPAPVSAGGRGRVRYATQVKHSPPTFVLFSNRKLPTGYLRYMERSLREAFGFEGSPVQVRVRSKRKGAD
ncbi:MAG: ribosome biogenesis GTPase Der [Acidimicrobiia bacterium]|nr:ribosome biogenesis GTPase Der [Acidimicrobiia bacterium]